MPLRSGVTGHGSKDVGMAGPEEAEDSGERKVPSKWRGWGEQEVRSRWQV